MLGRILNVVILFPTLLSIMLFLGVYPIIGYIIGRGFKYSFDTEQELIEILFENSAIDALIAMYKIVRYGKIE